MSVLPPTSLAVARIGDIRKHKDVEKYPKSRNDVNGQSDKTDKADKNDKAKDKQGELLSKDG